MLSFFMIAVLCFDDPKADPREALKGFQELIGGWGATGEPGTGSAAEKTRGFWKETINWSWKFKGDDAWLVFTIAKGKHFKGGEVRYVPDGEKFRVVLTGVDGKQQTFEGKLTSNGR